MQTFARRRSPLRRNVRCSAPDKLEANTFRALLKASVDIAMSRVRPLLYAGRGDVEGLVRLHALTLVLNIIDDNTHSISEDVHPRLGGSYAIRTRLIGNLRRLPEL